MNEISNGTWSEADAQNNAATPNGWPEGQPPSSVNDCARMMMGAIKRFWNRVNGAYATTGTGNAYLLTPTVPLPAYVLGERYSFRANAPNTGAATLDISGLGAKAIKKHGPAGLVPLAAGDIQAGQPVTVEYDGTDLVLVTPVAHAQTAAPADAAYVVLGPNATLAAERVLTAGNGVVLTDNGAGGSATVAIDKAGQADMGAQTADKVVTAEMLHFHPALPKLVCRLTNLTGTPVLSASMNALGTLAAVRNGTGDHIISWSVPLENGVVSLTAETETVGVNPRIVNVRNGGLGATSLRMVTVNAADTAVDVGSIYAVLWGDL